MLSRVRGCISSTRHTIVTFLALTATTLAQQAAPAAGGASDLAQLYAQGMSEFQAGDYAKAAADLDALLVKAEFSPQLEPAFFTVGSAYFNVPDHKKAIAAFKNYLAKFPNGPHVAEVSYAIGQAHLLSKNYSEAVAQFSTVEKDPRYREQALFFGATASKEGGKIDQAISILEKLSGAELKTPMSVRGAMMLAQLYSQKGKSDKTIRSTCQSLFKQLSSEVMDFLLKAYWYQADAAKLHVSVTDDQVKKVLNTAKKQQ